MIKTTGLMVALALFAIPLAAQDDDDLKKISAEFQAAGQDDDKIDAKEMEEFAGRALKLAQTKKGRVGFEGSLWVFYVCNLGDESTPEQKAKYRGPAMKVILDNYASSGRVAEIVAQYMNPRTIEELSEFEGYLASISAQSKEKSVLASALFKRTELLSMLEGTPKGLTKDQKDARAKAYVRLRDEFGELTNPADRHDPKRSYSTCVKGPLFEMENLQVGMVAPDIKGQDQDGIAFKLSDYRGKVVMLDFWGHW